MRRGASSQAERKGKRERGPERSVKSKGEPRGNKSEEVRRVGQHSHLRFYKHKSSANEVTVRDLTHIEDGCVLDLLVLLLLLLEKAVSLTDIPSFPSALCKWVSSLTARPIQFCK